MQRLSLLSGDKSFIVVQFFFSLALSWVVILRRFGQITDLSVTEIFFSLFARDANSLVVPLVLAGYRQNNLVFTSVIYLHFFESRRDSNADWC